MCSAPLDLFTMLQTNPGNENINEALRNLNINKLGGNRNKAFGNTIRRNEGMKGRVIGQNVDAIKMYKEVSKFLCLYGLKGNLEFMFYPPPIELWKFYTEPK